MTCARHRIDRFMVAVHDLEAAAAVYEQIGFTVGARNRHSWGTEDRLIRFGSSSIELITAGANADSSLHHETGRFSAGGLVRS